MKRSIWYIIFLTALISMSCIIKSLDGDIVYTAVKAQQKEPEKGNAMRKLKKQTKIPAGIKPSYYVGLRRSSYGLSKRNSADEWWVIRAQEFAGMIAGSVDSGYVQPLIVHIVSGYSGDGGSVFEFAKPKGYTGSTRGMVFSVDRGIDHEKALAAYDENGVQAIIQFEPGNSDMLANIEIAHQAFGHHSCIIGYGVDAEWYFTKESKDETGLPVKDEDAKKWMEKILSHNPEYTLFIKHWNPSRMPRTYRHPNLWYLSDSQIFPDLDSLMDDFSYWSNCMKEQVVGYQFGYPNDKKWWSTMHNPPLAISKRILADIPRAKFLFWVDFTADEVDFW